MLVSAPHNVRGATMARHFWIDIKTHKRYCGARAAHNSARTRPATADPNRKDQNVTLIDQRRKAAVLERNLLADRGRGKIP